jgi:hypothetical protein
MEPINQLSGPSLLGMLRRIFLIILGVLIIIVLITLPDVFFGIRKQEEYRQKIAPMIKQSLELALQIDTQQAAVNEDNTRIAQELKKPKEEQPADLDKQIQLNMERTQAIRGLIKQQQETIDNLRKIEEGLGIIPKKDSPEAKAVLEKY